MRFVNRPFARPAAEKVARTCGRYLGSAGQIYINACIGVSKRYASLMEYSIRVYSSVPLFEVINSAGR